MSIMTDPHYTFLVYGTGFTVASIVAILAIIWDERHRVRKERERIQAVIREAQSRPMSPTGTVTGRISGAIPPLSVQSSGTAIVAQPHTPTVEPTVTPTVDQPEESTDV